MKLSIEGQVDLLRPAVLSGFAAHMHLWLLGGALIGFMAAWILWHPVPLMFALFFGLVGLSERHGGANIVAAIKAYDFDESTPGAASISVGTWDSSNTYHVTVRTSDHVDWVYEFIPQGWQPADCVDVPAKIWQDKASGAPLLATVEGGIMIPRYPPGLPKQPFASEQ